MTEQLDKQDNQWEPCSSGEISGLVTKIKHRRRNSAMLEFGGGTLLGIVIAVAAFQFLNVNQNKDQLKYGGLTCAEVKAKATDYFADNLTAVEKMQVDLHLEACPRCGPIFKRMKELPTSALQQHDSFLQSARSCSACASHQSCQECQQRRQTQSLYATR